MGNIYQYGSDQEHNELITTDTVAMDAKQIIEFIHSYVTSKGHGELRNFERKLAPALRLSSENCWLTRALKKGDIKASALLLALDDLGLSEVMSSRGPMRLAANPPLLVTKIGLADGRGLSPEELREIDTLRLNKPAHAIDFFSVAAVDVSGNQKAAVFSILLSAFRSLLDYQAACSCYQHGLHHAKSNSDRAETHLRACLLFVELGSFGEAIYQAEEASSLFMKENSLSGVAEAVIAKASCMVAAGNGKEAAGLVKQMERVDFEIRPEFKASLLQLKGVLTKDLKSLILSFDLFKEHGFLADAAKTLWGCALMCESREESILALNRALKMLPAWCCVDRLLISFQQAELLVRCGEHEQALGILRRCLVAVDAISKIPGMRDILSEISVLGSKVSLHKLSELQEKITLCRTSFLRCSAKRVFG